MKKMMRPAGVKPAGGFVLIGVDQLCAAWTAYAEKRIRLVDLRAWFACWELVARRCTLAGNRKPTFSLAEVHRLIGGSGGRHLAASVRRLEAAALVQWLPDKLEFPRLLQDEASAMLRAITNNKRRVPVPRRVLRFLAKDGGRAIAATMLGHMLRCLYLRRGGCDSAGTCKASWIAEVFRVDVRNVKAARRQLAQMRWLTPGVVPQWRLNRFGASVSINLDWIRACPEGATARCGTIHKSPPLGSAVVTGSPPPESNQNLLTEYKNQNPACGRSPGAEKQEREENENGTSRWEHICPEDLRRMPRLMMLYREAVTRRLVAESEAGRLAFVAAAEHAQRVATFNPCGLFRTIVRKQLWHYITQSAEDAARMRLNDYFAFSGPSRELLAPATSGSVLLKCTATMDSQTRFGDGKPLMHLSNSNQRTRLGDIVNHVIAGFYGGADH